MARFALVFCFVFACLSASTAFSQIGRSKQGYVKTVQYTYNGQQFSIVTFMEANRPR